MERCWVNRLLEAAVEFACTRKVPFHAGSAVGHAPVDGAAYCRDSAPCDDQHCGLWCWLPFAASMWKGWNLEASIAGPDVPG